MKDDIVTDMYGIFYKSHGKWIGPYDGFVFSDKDIDKNPDIFLSFIEETKRELRSKVELRRQVWMDIGSKTSYIYQCPKKSYLKGLINPNDYSKCFITIENLIEIMKSGDEIWTYSSDEDYGYALVRKNKVIDHVEIDSKKYVFSTRL